MGNTRIKTVGRVWIETGRGTQVWGGWVPLVSATFSHETEDHIYYDIVYIKNRRLRNGEVDIKALRFYDCHRCKGRVTINQESYIGCEVCGEDQTGG